MTKTERTCPRCGLAFASEKLDGLCPGCLIASTLGAEDSGAEDDAAAFWEDDGPVSSVASDDTVRRFSHFHLLDELGRGGMGVVYRARDLTTERIVAVKVLQSQHLAVPDLVQRFRSEVRAVTSLDHPHVLPIHEVGEYNGVPFFSMKLTTGGSLAHRLGEFLGRPREVALLLAKVARGVQHAHERGILHRDLKPGNILLDSAGEPYVCDFGLAKWIEDDANLTVTAAILGTPHYIAPEQAAGNKGLTTAVDIYSLGAILYELLTGRPPFVGQTVIETLRQATECSPARPSSLTKNIPADLETICLKALEREPGSRYATAGALATDLENWLQGKAIAARPVTAVGQLWRWARRNPLAASLVASIATLITILAIVSTVSAVRIKESLYDSLIAQARASRSTLLSGRRGDALKALEQAARIHTSLEVRNETAAVLTLVDMTIESTTHLPRRTQASRFFDDQLRYVYYESGPGIIGVFDLTTKEEVARLGEGTSVIESITGDDRQTLVSLHRDGVVRGWNRAKRSKVFEFSAQPRRPEKSEENPQPWTAFSCAVHPRDNVVATPVGRGGVALVNLESGAEVGFVALPHVPNRIDFSPDGKRLACSHFQSAELSLHTFGTTETTTITLPSAVYCLDWHPTRPLLAVGCRDSTITLLNTETGETIAMLDGHNLEVTQVEFDPSGDHLASTSRDLSVRLWSVNALAEEVILNGYGGEPSLRFSPEGDRLVATDLDTQSVVLKIEGRLPVCQSITNGKPVGRATLMGSVAFSPDSNLVATACFESIDLWDARAGRHLASFPELDFNKEKSVRFGATGKSLLVGSRDMGVVEYDLRLEGSRYFLNRARQVYAEKGFMFSNRPPGDRHVLGLTSPRAGAARVIDLRSGEVVFKADNLPGVWDIALSPDQQWAALSFKRLESDGGDTQIWSVGRAALVTTLPTGDAAIARFSPNGRWITGNGTKGALTYEVGTWKPRPASTVPGRGAVYMPDSSLLAKGQEDGSIMLIDAASDTSLVKLEAFLLRGNGHRLAFSPDQSLLAAHSGDNTLTIWNLTLLRRELAARRLDWPQRASTN